MAIPTEAEKTLLRDMLAIDRTRLANERTLLAYIRTALALAVVGATLLHFLETALAQFGGIVFLVAAVVMFGVGLWRFRRVQKDLKKSFPSSGSV